MSREPRKSQGLGVNSYGTVEKLKEYKIISCIGQGSFGVIHKVERVTDKTVFAMKQLDYSKMSPKDRRQMLQEVSILDSLNHPNVVMLYDKILDKDEQKIYIVMEYCGGGDLGRIILSHKRSGKPIPENTIWQYFTQLVLALHHCHWPEDREKLAKDTATGLSLLDGGVGDATVKRRGTSSAEGAGQVLHRDLKPENIFLNEKQDMLKLGDFGLSKNLGGQMFTQTYVGTPLYMPPEILQENRYDTKSDIWSLGCLIFELCTLSSPFASARSQPELITMVNSGRVPSMPSYLSAKLKETVRSMLTLNAARRPSTSELMKISEVDFQRKLMNLTIRTEHIAAFKHRVELQAKTISAKEQSLLERERRVEQKELAVREAELQLFERTEGVRQQYGDFLKNRSALEADKVTFERQKYIWEREKAALLQNLQTQKTAAVPPAETSAASRTGPCEGVPAVSSVETKESAASNMSADERSVSQMIGGSQEGAMASRSSPSLSATDSESSSRRSFIPTRQALQERSYPNTSLGHGRARQPIEADTPCKMPGSYNPADISRMLVDSPASSRTPLRRKAQTRSMGNLREQAKLDVENMPPSPDESEDGASPMDQGTPFSDKLSGRASVSSPSEYRSRLEKANERKMAEARAELAPFKASIRARASSTAATPAPVSRLPTYTWRENMTPAKWSPDSAGELPSPFLKPPPPPMPTLTRAKLGGAGSDLRQLAFRNAQAAIMDAALNGQ